MAPWLIISLSACLLFRFNISATFVVQQFHLGHYYGFIGKSANMTAKIICQKALVT